MLAATAKQMEQAMEKAIAACRGEVARCAAVFEQARETHEASLPPPPIPEGPDADLDSQAAASAQPVVNIVDADAPVAADNLVDVDADDLWEQLGGDSEFEKTGIKREQLLDVLQANGFKRARRFVS